MILESVFGFLDIRFWIITSFVLVVLLFVFLEGIPCGIVSSSSFFFGKELAYLRVP